MIFLIPITSLLIAEALTLRIKGIQCTLAIRLLSFCLYLAGANGISLIIYGNDNLNQMGIFLGLIQGPLLLAFSGYHNQLNKKIQQ